MFSSLFWWENGPKSWWCRADLWFSPVCLSLLSSFDRAKKYLSFFRNLQTTAVVFLLSTVTLQFLFWSVKRHEIVFFNVFMIPQFLFCFRYQPSIFYYCVCFAKRTKIVYTLSAFSSLLLWKRDKKLCFCIVVCLIQFCSSLMWMFTFPPCGMVGLYLSLIFCWLQQDILPILRKGEEVARSVGGQVQGNWVGCWEWVFSTWTFFSGYFWS